ncbi:MAG: PLP-dependent aminotransferase family protein [Firmicutes bacterium]|nr:PLP-dependent aminotransferase family protein [Bacillota bacterium]
MKVNFSERVSKYDFQGEFLDIILKAAADPSLTSFAGGLPNQGAFPTEKVREAANKVFDTMGYRALQYNAAEGYRPLREKIAARYKKTMGLDYTADEVIVTTGSQQALDMFSACLLNERDQMIVENPSYLAALQVFHHYNPDIQAVDLLEDGIDTEQLAEVVKNGDPKFLYMIPNFQNPTGLTYSEETRAKVAEILKGTNTLVLEDNPYGEIRFAGTQGNSLAYYLPEQTALIGTFSKIVAPGMRVGWIATKNKELLEKFAVFKSSMDLHTSILDQMIINQYLEDNDLDEQIVGAVELYKNKATKMMECMDKYLPEEVSFTRPQGGMFLWATMPEGIKAVDVQFEAIKAGVVILAGDPFYEYDREVRTMRLNYSVATDEQIENGIKILGDVIRKMMAEKK